MFTVDIHSLDGVVVISILPDAPPEALLEALKQEESLKCLAQERPILLESVSCSAAQRAVIFAALHEYYSVFAREEPDFQSPCAFVWFSRDPNFSRGAKLSGCGRLVRKGPHKDVGPMIEAGQTQWNEHFAQLAIAP